MLDIVVSVTAVILLSVILYTVFKNNKDIGIGEAVNLLISKHHISIVVVILILINFAEGLWAASIHPKGELPINPIARFFGHLSIAAFAITCGIAFSSKLHDIVHKKVKVGGTLIFLLFILFVGAIFLPILNLMIIAGGLGEFYNVIYMFYSPIVAISQMQYGMVATVALTTVHLFAQLYDFAVIVHTAPYLSNSNEKPEPTKGSAKKQTVPPNEAVAKNVEKSLERYIDKCLEFMGVNNPEYRIKTLTFIRASSSNPIINANLLKKLHEIVTSIDAYNDSGVEDEEIKASIKKNVEEFFKASPRNGEGLGLPLPKGK